MKPDYAELTPDPFPKCRKCGVWRDVVAITALCMWLKPIGEFRKALKCKRGGQHDWS